MYFSVSAFEGFKKSVDFLLKVISTGYIILKHVCIHAKNDPNSEAHCRLAESFQGAAKSTTLN